MFCVFRFPCNGLAAVLQICIATIWLSCSSHENTAVFFLYYQAANTMWPARYQFNCGTAALHCLKFNHTCTGPRSAVGKVSGNRCESDFRSRGREFDPGPVPYFRGDWLWNNFYIHSPPFRWISQEGLLSVTSESMCTKYWLTACSSWSMKKCG